MTEEILFVLQCVIGYAAIGLLAYAVGSAFLRANRGPHDKIINRDRRDRPVTPQDWRR